MKNNILIISPHLDDAVLSCGAAMAQWQKEGAEVMAASVFTSCADYKPELIGIYENRRKQDIVAVEFLGAKAIHLGFTDAPFRSKNYLNFSTILFHHTDEDELLENAISTAISSLIREYSPDKIFFPLGVGGHIDHHLTYRSSCKISFPSQQIYFYEELPYALVPGWTEVRLHQLGYNHSISFPQKLPSSLLDVELPFIHNYTMDEADKKASNIQYLKELDSLKIKNNGIEKELVQEKRSFNKQSLERKCEAILYYQTEWPTLFEKAENIKRILNPHSGEVYTESFWTKN